MSWNQSYGYGRPQRRSNPARLGCFGVIAIIILGVIGVGGYALIYNSTRHSETCTVESKDRGVTITDGNSKTNYRVYTKDCGVFVVSDAFWQGKFNSADTYASIQSGKTYKFDVIGWRNGFLSLFPDILGATEVKS